MDTNPLTNAAMSSTGLVSVDVQFEGVVMGLPESKLVAAGTNAVPRTAPVVQVGTLMLTTYWKRGGPARPSRKSCTHAISAVAPVAKSGGDPRPCEIATAGMLSRPPTRAAPTVPEMFVIGTDRFWPSLMPETSRSGFTWRYFRPYRTASAGKPCTALAG